MWPGIILHKYISKQSSEVKLNVPLLVEILLSASLDLLDLLHSLDSVLVQVTVILLRAVSALLELESLVLKERSVSSISTFELRAI